MPYMCPQCETVMPSWPLLKAHLVQNHKAQEYKESTKEQIEQFAISEEEAKERKRKKVLGKAAAIKEVPTEPVERLEAILPPGEPGGPGSNRDGGEHLPPHPQVVGGSL